MENALNDIQELLNITSLYYNGLYNNDFVMIEGIFRPEACIYEDYPGKPVFQSLTSYIKSLKRLTSADASGFPYSYNLKQIYAVNGVAAARFQLYMLGRIYYYFFHFRRAEGCQWLIAALSITVIEEIEDSLKNPRYIST